MHFGKHTIAWFRIRISHAGVSTVTVTLEIIRKKCSGNSSGTKSHDSDCQIPRLHRGLGDRFRWWIGWKRGTRPWVQSGRTSQDFSRWEPVVLMTRGSEAAWSNQNFAKKCEHLNKHASSVIRCGMFTIGTLNVFQINSIIRTWGVLSVNDQPKKCSGYKVWCLGSSTASPAFFIQSCPALTLFFLMDNRNTSPTCDILWSELWYAICSFSWEVSDFSDFGHGDCQDADQAEVVRILLRNHAQNYHLMAGPCWYDHHFRTT